MDGAGSDDSPVKAGLKALRSVLRPRQHVGTRVQQRSEVPPEEACARPKQ